ncbi:MAG: hypothetical protein ACFHU9_09090 [Fluviicola sp.]
MSLQNAPTLYQKIKKGSEGGHEFARILIQLLTADSLAKGYKFITTSDASGDYKGVDAIAIVNGKKIGFQFKFYPTTMSSSQKSSVIKSYKNAIEKFPEMDQWILVTPEDFDFRVMDWFDEKFPSDTIDCQHWGHAFIRDLMLKHKQIGKLYYDDLKTSDNNSLPTIKEQEDFFIALTKSNQQAIRVMSSAQPTFSDCQQVFSNEYAGFISDVYHVMFRNIAEAKNSYPLGNKTRVKIESSTITDIQNFTDNLPGGMRQIFLHENALRPGTRFFSIKYLKDDDEHGFNQSIWCHINGRWVYFPKPWRIIMSIKEMRKSKEVNRIVRIIRIFGFKRFIDKRDRIELGILMNLISERIGKSKD